MNDDDSPGRNDERVPGRQGRVCVVGSINMDLIARVERAPEAGETVFGTGLFRVPGGKGANQAVAAARAGAVVTILGAVGEDDFGRDLLRELEVSDVVTDHVLRLSSVPTGTALIIVESSGENRIVVLAGANNSYTRELASQAQPLLEACDVLCCSLEVPIDTVTELAALASIAGCTVVVDPAPAQKLPEKLLEHTDILTPNRSEAALLLKLHGLKMPAEELPPVQVAAHLASLGIAHVLLTLGADGVLYYSRERAMRLNAHRVRVVDTTAAGDAFAGALSARLAAGIPVLEAAAFANAAGALAATRLGAQPSMPQLAEILQLLNEQPTQFEEVPGL